MNFVFFRIMCVVTSYILTVVGMHGLIYNRNDHYIDHSHQITLFVLITKRPVTMTTSVILVHA